MAQTPTWPELPDLEMPDEPPELEVNGLESMTTLASKPEPSQVAAPKGSWAKADLEILRGITLRSSLRWGGMLWRKDPQYLKTAAREALYRRSKPMKHLDAFISHSWASKGRRKVLSLMMQSGCNHALIFWFLGVVLAAVLCYTDVLPMSFTYLSGAASFKENCPLGPWIMIFGFVGTWVGLMLSPYLPGCMRDNCFVDVACIHQADEALTRRGILGIGGFLSVSRELRILWSPVYLTRLWCVFEVATFKKINPDGRVVLAPIFLETIVVLFYGTILTGSIMYWLMRGAGYVGFSVVPFELLLAILPFLITIHLLRTNYQQKHQLFSEFGKFDLDSVECFSKADRDFIYAAIAELYGSNEAFTKYVQGPLRQELLGPLTKSVGPQKYGLLIVSPLLSMLMEFMLALLKQGATPDVVLLFVAANIIFGVFFSMRSNLIFLVLLCDHFAEPVRRFPFVDYLQTFMIFLAFLLHFLLGGLLCLIPLWTGRWEMLPGIFIVFGLMLVALNWLQRKSDAHRMSKAVAASG